MYLELLKQILSIVNRENDLNGNNIVEKIKEQLKKRSPYTYEEWEKKNFDINHLFSYDSEKESTLLHIGCLDNQENVVNALLAVDGINVDLQDKDERTPLYLAAEKGKMEIVEALLDKGSNCIDLPDKYGHTPLYIAADNNHHKVVRALLEKGANPLVKGRCNKNLAEMVTEDAIMRGIVYGVGIFVIASVVAAIVVTSAYFIGVSLSVGAMAGIAVAAAVLTGLVAGGIIYEVYKPCNELKEAIAQAMSNPGKKLNGVDV